MNFKSILLIIIILVNVLFVGSKTMAQNFEGWRASKYLDEIAGQRGVDLKVNKDSAEIIGNIVARVVGFLGVIFLILILYAAYGMLTAGGNSEEVAKSLAIIKWSIVGAIVVFGAYVISYYIVNEFSSNLSKPPRPEAPLEEEEDIMLNYDCSQINCAEFSGPNNKDNCERYSNCCYWASIDGTSGDGRCLSR